MRLAASGIPAAGMFHAILRKFNAVTESGAITAEGQKLLAIIENSRCVKETPAWIVNFAYSVKVHAGKSVFIDEPKTFHFWTHEATAAEAVAKCRPRAEVALEVEISV